MTLVEQPSLRLPGPVPAHWSAVRDYLTRALFLDPALLEQCRHSGTLYADHRRNAVFTCRDLTRHTVGVELVGTDPLPDASTFKGLAPGSCRDRGGFWLASSPDPPTAIPESVVDALSRCHPRLRRLRPPGAKDWNNLLRPRAPR